MATKKAATKDSAPASAPRQSAAARPKQEAQQLRAGAAGEATSGAIFLTLAQQQTLTSNWNRMSSLMAANTAILASVGLPLTGAETGI